MKTIGILALGLSGIAASGNALALDWFHSDCEYKKDIDKTLDADGASQIEIIAFAGELVVKGVAGQSEVRVGGEACSDEQDLLDRTDVTVHRAGDLVQIIVDVQRTNEESSDRNWVNVIVDLDITLPANIPVSVQDSSGDMRLNGLSSLSVGDSSGDIEIEDIESDVLIRHDSSGDIVISRVGDVVIEIDSSGNIEVNDAKSLLVNSDSSGGIRARRIEGDVNIGVDSSGGITVDEVGGDFVVGNDSSGDIRYEQVAGEVRIPRHKQH